MNWFKISAKPSDKNIPNIYQTLILNVKPNPNPETLVCFSKCSLAYTTRDPKIITHNLVTCVTVNTSKE